MRQEATGVTTAMASSTGDGEITRAGILKLMKARDDIDEQITALGGILESVSIYTYVFSKF